MNCGKGAVGISEAPRTPSQVLVMVPVASSRQELRRAGGPEGQRVG